MKRTALTRRDRSVSNYSDPLKRRSNCVSCLFLNWEGRKHNKMEELWELSFC